MMNIKNIFGDENKKYLKKIQPIVEKINSLESEVSSLSDDDLKAKTQEFKNRLKEGEALDNLLPEAFAVVRETSKRNLNERHYDVQLIGGVILHQGRIAEMRTGEGKTLVATLPVYLNALSGKGVHVVTVNDYLSRRDAVWMGQIYSFLGLSVGIINSEASYIYDPNHKELDEERDEEGSYKVVNEFLRPCTRQQAYDADITYGTNNEFGFDYLRDNIEYRKEEIRQRGYNFAIVDEIDSILIDEARTPLIISAPTTESEDLYAKFAKIAQTMIKDQDFTVEEKYKAIKMTDLGIEKAEKFLGIENIYTERGIKFVHHLETAVRAKALFSANKEYVVREGEVVIVDEFTGRMQPGRRWSDGLHQAIEAKEGLKVQKESRTFASITFQNYFRLYKKLSGMTGTAKTSAEEFYKVYGLETTVAPTHREIKRIDRDDLIFQTETGKFKALAKKIKELNKNGQPVLIGTVSIEKNELLSQYLKAEGVKHELLNAKNHEREGEIVARAGEKGRVTIATNMAGRGVDIKLGGVPFDKTKYEEVKSLGGLFVIGTERHDSRRIDNQLRGRSGRQGDPGETQFFVSLEDSLMRIFASDMVKNMMGRLGIPEDEPIQNKMITRSLESAQTKIEGFNFDSRKHVLQYDDVLNFQRKIVYEKRRRILFGANEEISDFLNEIIEDVYSPRTIALANEVFGTKEEMEKLVQDKKDTLGEAEFFTVMRRLLLQTTDMLWVEHLEVMDYLRSSVNLRAYGQRDPLVEYKREGLTMFKEMQWVINEKILHFLPSMGEGAFVREQQQLKATHESAKNIAEQEGSGTEKNQQPIVKGEEEKIGRNDLCPCGSGKKYKKCHGK
ncbi:TPA: preprotein translocase subunit SecA [Candidatus Campbellbacteria bacterium]|nr:MAG: Protein translocase subunit SecA [Candidatus Campbellbacteria bacterium GW2011_GWD2_35_24]KKP75980.1 MAG: Protein translocase subunit SecA, preprotein translocase subunit SecA [Candidatus Campbellbacteria bacterium GW2011_GWC2_35_28]KKP77169.1 MAG: Protein translocase subunit SecA [Candidatus Campbellbacteria bacterium GW2011_GWC1_35_31]KKP79098.1 MAG: Protein translocase subunit SecA [Candidatus Campbellbacteria bacterium GW2011_GWD1_35_49]HAP73711.1 preprotein translocase subunit SecA